MKSKLKNFSLLTISTLIMAVGIYFFKFANNFTFGGITGIAVLVAKFLPISASDFSFVVNILLLIIGWIVLGKSFAEKTAYSTILLSVSLSLLERIYPMSHPLTNEPLLVRQILLIHQHIHLPIRNRNNTIQKTLSPQQILRCSLHLHLL